MPPRTVFAYIQGMWRATPFRNRVEAGRELGRAVAARLGKRDDVIVLGLPRGGVPVAYEVAKALEAPLDVFVVRKLGVPGHRELAMGAIASGGVLVVDEGLTRALGIGEDELEGVIEGERRELERREIAYRDGRARPEVEGRTVILCDDGLATGATMRAASLAVRRQRPERIVIAVPVAAAQTCDELRRDVDELVCAATPSPFHA